MFRLMMDKMVIPQTVRLCAKWAKLKCEHLLGITPVYHTAIHKLGRDSFPAKWLFFLDGDELLVFEVFSFLQYKFSVKLADVPYLIHYHDIGNFWGKKPPPIHFFAPRILCYTTCLKSIIPLSLLRNWRGYLYFGLGKDNAYKFRIEVKTDSNPIASFLSIYVSLQGSITREIRLLGRQEDIELAITRDNPMGLKEMREWLAENIQKIFYAMDITLV